jgi:hypothetical protein
MRTCKNCGCYLPDNWTTCPACFVNEDQPQEVKKIIYKETKPCEPLSFSVSDTRTEWESRADEILSYYVPSYAHWDNKNKTLYFFDNGYGWSMYFAKKHLKLKDRKFWKLHAGCGGWRIRKYLIDKFELEGFTKEVGNCYDGWTEITFRMKTED